MSVIPDAVVLDDEQPIGTPRTGVVMRCAILTEAVIDEYPFTEFKCRFSGGKREFPLKNCYINRPVMMFFFQAPDGVIEGYAGSVLLTAPMSPQVWEAIT